MNRGRIECIITDFAARQYGLVTREQLLGAGVTPHTIRSRVRSGRLRPVQRGVYRVGPLVHPRENEMAAVLICGRDAAISHGSAGFLWRIREARGGAVEVTVPARTDRGRRPGIRVHRVRSLPRDEVTEFDGLPITTPARTLLDLASEARPRELEQALATALRRGLVDRAGLAALAARYPRRPGVPLLRSLLEAETEPALTASEAEERCLALIRRARLPPPEVNALCEGFRVDFLWRSRRLVVEVDGFAFHSSRESFESDRRRDAVLAAAGFRVMRFTWRQLTREAEATAIQLALALNRGAAG